MNKSSSIASLLVMAILFSSNSYAKNYKEKCNEKDLGMYFYCKNDISKEEDENGEIEKPDSSKDKPISRAQLAKKLTENTRQEFEDLLNQAIHFGTEEDIRKLLEFNNRNLDKSALFAGKAKQIIWQDAGLSNLKIPVSGVGKRVWIDEKTKEEKQTILKLNERYGIFFIYRSDCPYCHKYSPILKSFADEYNLQVVAISLDGKGIKEWPNSKIDSGQAERLNITSVPATLLFDKQTEDLIIVGFGVLSHSSLLERINILIKGGDK